MWRMDSLQELWCETEEDREWEAAGREYFDIFDLRILFGIDRPEPEYIPEAPWVVENYPLELMEEHYEEEPQVKNIFYLLFF